MGAIFAFVFLEAGLYLSGAMQSIAQMLMGTGRGWILVMVAFIGVSFIADRWARSNTSIAMQYAGLGLYVVAEVVIFAPMLYLASFYDPQAIPTAGLVTLILFGGLTGIVFITRRDFSFMRGLLWMGTLGAFAIIVAAVLFGFSLGVFFSGFMIVLAGGWILYDTSNILHRYRTDQHVSAALALFASVALLFWYVLRIFMNRR